MLVLLQTGCSWKPDVTKTHNRDNNSTIITTLFHMPIPWAYLHPMLDWGSVSVFCYITIMILHAPFLVISPTRYGLMTTKYMDTPLNPTQSLHICFSPYPRSWIFQLEKILDRMQAVAYSFMRMRYLKWNGFEISPEGIGARVKDVGHVHIAISRIIKVSMILVWLEPLTMIIISLHSFSDLTTTELWVRIAHIHPPLVILR